MRVIIVSVFRLEYSIRSISLLIKWPMSNEHTNYFRGIFYSSIFVAFFFFFAKLTVQSSKQLSVLSCNFVVYMCVVSDCRHTNNGAILHITFAHSG